ncbi:MAG: beta-N-acetylhexosaminidase [Phaeodactylibacter sp.]|uniref:beta-N-acetylhexosaminidase n=1 Tax=Phaeodactylibacter sp. TaxID=1940289 RepID=UPI0032EB4642
MQRIFIICITLFALTLTTVSTANAQDDKSQERTATEKKKKDKRKALRERMNSIPQERLAEDVIIPQPNLAKSDKGRSVIIGADTEIEFDASDKALATAVGHLERWLASQRLQPVPDGQEKTTLQIRIVDSLDQKEAYRLRVSQKGIALSGSDAAGVFYGIQSLIQLSKPWERKQVRLVEIPYSIIQDKPAFAYRGMHLDVGRHMFPVAAVKSYIDMLARYKMNRFHWHLTEDQGWRIEIKQYPKLQEVAAYRKETLKGHYSDQPQQFDGKRYGGYYTQEEVKEIVRYAQERFITVIPEIELPGHAQAAIAAYPELGCTDKPVEVATKWGIFENVYCPSEATFTFLENVLTEVMALFPSEYIHIGGDECPKTQWEESKLCQQIIKAEGLKDEHELQSWFIQRIEQFLNAKGRQIIGWDEILEGGLAPNATVMSWRGEAGGIEAAKQGHDVVMTPTTYCYFDYYQSNHPDEPLAIGGYLPLDKVYNYHPVPEELTEEEARHILGAQGNVWTEYIPTPSKLQYMAYPRMQALSEVVWSGKRKPGYTDFIKRLSYHLDWMENEGINAANHIYDVDLKVIGGQGEPLKIAVSNPVGEGRFSLKKSPATGQFDFTYLSPFEPEYGTYTAQCYVKGVATGRPASITFNPHLAAGQKLTLETEAHPKYNGAQPQVVLNGINGSDERYGDAEWLGLEGQDFTGTIEWSRKQWVTKATLRFFHSPGQWVYAPKRVKISTWDEAKNTWETLGTTEVTAPNGKIAEVELNLGKTTTSKVRVEIENHGKIEAGEQGAGHEAWLFVDEIRID